MTTTRRAFALTGAAAALSACATTATTERLVFVTEEGFSLPLQPNDQPLRLAPVHVSEDRVIRSVAGLRPFRPQGFVVRAENIGGKTVVHNYGHGGGGITLSWGTSHLAVDEGFAGPERDYAVIGCGAVGLATARLIQMRGGRVTIYAKDLPPNTTSNIAGGQWWPSSVFDRPAISAEFDAQFQRAARLSYYHYQNLVGPTHGVRWIRNYTIGGVEGAIMRSLSDIAPEMKYLRPGEHPFGDATVHQYDTMMVEPPIYLRAMMEDVYDAGGRIIVRELHDRNEIAALPEPVVFNCSGLGARDLVGDEALMPIKGQLVVLLPQPEVNYNLLGGGAYMFPRADGVILGGTHERGNWDDTPTPETTAQILAMHQRIFGRMGAKG